MKVGRNIYSPSGVLIARVDTELTKTVYEKVKAVVGYNGDRRFVEDRLEGLYLSEPVFSKVGICIALPGQCIDGELLGVLRRNGGDVYVGTGVDVSPEEDSVAVLPNRVRERAYECMNYIFHSPGSEQGFRMADSLACDICSCTDGFGFIDASLEELRICDEYTFKHSVDVAVLASSLARSKGWSEDRVHMVALAGLVHDLGKVKVPNEILNKPGRLTDEEFTVIKKHVDYGYELVEPSSLLPDEVKVGMHEHHEKMNGFGYSSGIKGYQISDIGRMLAVADIYDAIVTARPYKSAKSPAQAVGVLFDCKEQGHIDGEYYHRFVSSLILYGSGSKVTLSDGSTGVVLRQNPGYPHRPIIKVGTFCIDLLRDVNYSKVEIVS